MPGPRQTPKRRRGQRGPTIADVAAAAGVSAMTVSRVVNGDARVLEATRVRVRDAVNRLGYVPNQVARSLAGGRQVRIALLHSNPSAAYLSEFLVGALAGASSEGAQLVVEHCGEGGDPAALAARFSRQGIDGCLLPPPLCDDQALIDALAAASIPIVQVATGSPHPAGSAVTIDDAAAVEAIVARLVANGHRRIGFITGNRNQTASALRREGYAGALASAGLPFDAGLVAEGDFSYRSGLAAAEYLLQREPRPTAIFASNDDMAAAAIAVAHRLGLDVPRDLSVCGFDDSAMATTVWPELTTIRQPIAAMAQCAVSLLVERLGSGREGAHVHRRLAFELVPRASDTRVG